jgi:hypothetical protein
MRPFYPQSIHMSYRAYPQSLIGPEGYCRFMVLTYQQDLPVS